MEESVTYQAILAKGWKQGALEELRKVMVLVGSERFGRPDADVLAAIQRINDLEALRELVPKVLTAPGWREWLVLPNFPSRRRKQQ